MRTTLTPVNRALNEIFRRQCELVTRSQALETGLSVGALAHRLKADGPWRVVLPGVYLSHTGLLSVGQREMAAVLYAGAASVITGPAALGRQGIRIAPSDEIDVLIPAAAQRQSARFVRTHRTTRMPDKPRIIDGLRWAPPSRAIADTARDGSDLRAVRALVADAVQHRKCTIGELAAELDAGSRRWSAALRVTLEEVSDGVASVPEGDLRLLIKRTGLPEPMYNPDLYVGSQFLARPDLYWRDAGVAGEVDSKEWHLLPEQWAETMERHRRMSAQGIIVLHFAPSQVWTDTRRVAAELQAAIDQGRNRPPLEIRAVPSSQARRLTP